MAGQFALKARRCTYVFARIRQRLLRHLFLCQRQRNVFSKTSHLDAYKAPASASPFFFTEGDETPSKKRYILIIAVMFSNGLLMQYFTKTEPAIVSWKIYCIIKGGAQTYDFIADKSCLLFSIIPKVLSG